MSEEALNDDLIEVPSFLAASTYATSRATDCGSCQSTVESCGSGEYGQCSACEGMGCMSSESCSESSCGDSQAACGECSSQGGCAGGQCGSSEWCGGCEDGCQDCQSSCQNSCQSCQTNGQKNNIDPWSWSSSNGSATASQTASAYNAITNQGFVSDFSYVVWNDMVSKVNNVLSASSGSWNSKYATYSETLINASDKTLTATKFNSLRYNIGLRSSTGISEVSPGDTVYGSYFITMANAINSWINSL